MRVGIKEMNKGSGSSPGLVRGEPLAPLGLQAGRQPLPTHGEECRLADVAEPAGRQHHVRKVATALKNMSVYIQKSWIQHIFMSLLS